MDIILTIDYPQIVPKDSATLGLPTAKETCHVTKRDHHTICKFLSAEDPEWIEISATITEEAHVATNSFNYNPTIYHRKAMFTPQVFEDEG